MAIAHGRLPVARTEDDDAWKRFAASALHTPHRLDLRARGMAEVSPLHVACQFGIADPQQAAVCVQGPSLRCASGPSP
ncbi:hypothetical protein G6F40_017415 [Rhizopus arrhizus]|nr:hypothetical protein G6F40_017415 [Rhizopus arrhizus]